MKSNDAMQLSVNKIGSGTLNIDGPEILFRHSTGIPNTDSGIACAQPFNCLTPGLVGPVTRTR
jgi:hypothetical protein